MDNLYYYNMGRAVPDAAKKRIQGGRMNGKTDINPVWRIKTLTEMFGPCGIGWYYKSIREWLEPHGDSVAAFVKIELYVRCNGEWSMPIQGTGGSMFVEMQKNGPYVSDECYKMATTDAISVACKQLGIGADVYWDKDPTKYSLHDGQGQQSRDGKARDKGSMPEGGAPSRQEDAIPDKGALLAEFKAEIKRTGKSCSYFLKEAGADKVEDLAEDFLGNAISVLRFCPSKKQGGK